ncbi:MAG: hypothetical protein J7J92_02830 [Candidatus Aenigmarchaeota archaeon]|nr:hypothetical protein [Candidatus Aenigmarchaeota archaeon]
MFEKEIMSLKNIKQTILKKMKSRKAIIKSLNKKISYLSNLDKNLKKITPEKIKLNKDMLFKFENLLPLTKEYWWLWFISEEKQLVLTFGRNYSNFKVNKKLVKKSSGSAKQCFVVGWFFDKKKTRVFNCTKKFIVGKNFVKSVDGEIIIKGEYPNFDIKISKKSRILFSGKLRKHKYGYKLERYSKAMFHYDILNVYSNFYGKLNNKKLSGFINLQKVIIRTPFVPWNWCRIRCKNGSINFFIPYINISNIKQILSSNIKITIGKKLFRFKNVDIIKTANNMRWVIKAKNLFIVLESYEKEKFELQNIGRHFYIEYLVKVKDFYLKKGEKIYTMKDIGQGYGMLEDAFGYVI